MNIKKIKDKIKRLIRGGVTPDELRKRGAKIGTNVVIWTDKIDKGHAFLLEIGNDVIISDARILLHDASTKLPIGYSRVGKVVIGNNVFVGADAIILPGIKIGNNVVIGAGSIVTKNIPDNSVHAGNPAKQLCTYEEFVSKNESLFKKGPVFETYWANKSDKEKSDMKKTLNNTIGFDV